MALYQLLDDFIQRVNTSHLLGQRNQGRQGALNTELEIRIIYKISVGKPLGR
jgi:hypothetical protein